MSLQSLLRGLADARIRFIAIGGVAGQLHGSTRLTNDLDICYDPSPENVAALGALLQSWRAYLRGVEPGQPFTVDARSIAASDPLTLTTSEGDLDIFRTVAGIGDYHAALGQSVEFDIDEVRVRALALDALIAAKQASGRPRDQEHLIELRALRDIRAQRTRHLGDAAAGLPPGRVSATPEAGAAPPQSATTPTRVNPDEPKP